MNRNDSVPLPSNTREWFFNRNSMIILANIALFAVMYFSLPFDPQVVLGICMLT
ncbi:Anion transporter, partial [Vibrio sinaloensis]